MTQTIATLETSPETQQAVDYSFLTQAKDGSFNWFFTTLILIFHLGALAAFFTFRWSSLLVFLVMWIFAQNVGIAIGYHRLLTHRGYVTPKWLEYFIAVCGTMALQGGPIYWVAVHRLHHQLTDRPGDPHSPRDGKWWSHIGWILRGSLHSETRLLAKYAPDLARDPFYEWLSKYNWVPVTAVGIGLLLAGGWSWVFWGVFLRTTLGWHVTWLVNSATHMWGSRRFSTRDDSTNNWWVALLTGGEGWHNNHHAHPVSCRHGLAWYELDINYACIRLLAAVGLVRKIKVATVDGTSVTHA
jgi:stearoyl-CoA desaturase (delta-9 desaturase)